MAGTEHIVQIDPRLEVALEGIEAPLQAVFTLKREGTRPLPPAETAAIVDSIVARASSASGLTPDRVKVFRSLQSFAVEASPRFLKSLLRESQISKAALNAR